ncbi:MAG: TonB-dependent receptor plug domain-containing protein, partial [Xanthomonadales bacterium]|nr:TonB-dependent receptor plug domain-containing protein [Xanthomonadales bacterium]
MIASLFLLILMQSSIAASAPAEELPGQDPLENSTEAVALPVIEVRSQRLKIGQSVNSSLSTLQNDAILLEAPKHPNEIFDQVPGAWISRGSGQEHLTAIRSPVLTGSGACGGFMVLEDEIPTRPSGFCNVNQLFEVNVAQARQINVLRGPGTVTYGSNALHGAIDILTPGPSADPFAEYGLEIG